MKALLLKDYKQLEVTNMPDPEIGPEEILVQVKACGICGSDVHFVGAEDAHGAAIIIAAESAGKTPQQFIAEMAAARGQYLSGFLRARPAHKSIFC